MPLPPSKAGACQLTVAAALPATAVTLVGMVGSGLAGLPVSQRSPWSDGQGSAPGAPSHPNGSMAVQPLVTYTPKCRCGPLLQPVLPLCPITCPRLTLCPGDT